MNQRKQQVEQLTETNKELNEKLKTFTTKIDTQNQELAKLKLQKQKIDAQSGDYRKDLMQKTEKLKAN